MRPQGGLLGLSPSWGGWVGGRRLTSLPLHCCCCCCWPGPWWRCRCARSRRWRGRRPRCGVGGWVGGSSGRMDGWVGRWRRTRPRGARRRPSPSWKWPWAWWWWMPWPPWLIRLGGGGGRRRWTRGTPRGRVEARPRVSWSFSRLEGREENVPGLACTALAFFPSCGVGVGMGLGVWGGFLGAWRRVGV